MKTTWRLGTYLVSTALALTLALGASAAARAAEIRVTAGFDNGAVYVAALHQKRAFAFRRQLHRRLPRQPTHGHSTYIPSSRRVKYLLVLVMTRYKEEQCNSFRGKV